jgi:ribosomal protein L40E
MNRVCPKCGAENGLAAVHCRNCSIKLPEPTLEMMGPPPSKRRRSFLHTFFWVLLLLAVGIAGFWARENLTWRDVRSGTAGFCENWQHVQSGVVGALQRWYSKWLSAEPMPAPAPAVTSAPTPAPVPQNIVKIRCRRCKGLGYTGDGFSKSTCILCNQEGGRTIILPEGAEVCSTCYGMGQIVDVVHGRELRMQCKMCAGKGYVVRKY